MMDGASFEAQGAGGASQTGGSLSSLSAISTASDIRVAIVDAAITIFRRQAFHEVTYGDLAAHTGLSLARIEAQFPTWDSLVVAVIDRWNGQRMRPLLPLTEQGAVVFLRGIVRANIADPALMRLLTATVNIAATPDHPMASHLHHEWHRFHSLVKSTLAADIQAGREPATMEPGRGAEQLIALYEGLQLQSMVRPGMNLLDAYDRAVTRLRDGWARIYTPPVWNLDA